MLMDNIGLISVLVVLATIFLPAGAIALSLWMGGMNPPDEQDGTPGSV